MIDLIILAASTDAPKPYTIAATIVAVLTVTIGFGNLWMTRRDDKRKTMVFQEDSIAKRVKLLEETLDGTVEDLSEARTEIKGMKEEIKNLRTKQENFLVWVETKFVPWAKDPRSKKLLSEHPLEDPPR